MEKTISPMYNNTITEFDRKYTERFVPKILQSERGFVQGMLRGYFEEQANSTCPAPIRDLTDCIPYPDMSTIEESGQYAGTIAGLVQDVASVGLALVSLGSRVAGLFQQETSYLADYIQADPVLNTLKNLFYAKLAGQTISLIYSKGVELDKKKNDPQDFESYKIPFIDLSKLNLNSEEITRREKNKYGAQQ